jgi:cell division protein FtsB
MRWRLLADVVAPALMICWIANFAYEAALGPTGYRALHGLKRDIVATSAQLSHLIEERSRLERIAEQLNPKSLDPDLVDEKIRVVLGYVDEEEQVVPRDQLDQLLGRSGGP